MAITPTGAPAWVRSNDHTVYGGDLNKRNYQSQGAVNGQTDITAEELTRLAADLAAVARTAPFAVLTYTMNDTVPAAPTQTDYDAMAGANPAGTRNDDGDAEFEWATFYLDAYGRSGSVHIAHAEATLHGLTAGEANVSFRDDNADTLNEIVRVRVRDTSDVAITDATVTLTIWTSVVP